MAPFKDLKNMTFGKLLVIERKGSLNNTAAWMCQCVCGSKKIIRSGDLISGHTVSCGCHKKTITTKYINPAEATARIVYRHGRYNNGNMTFEQFMLLSQKNCTYCDSPPSNKQTLPKNNSYTEERINKSLFVYNGLDRINSSRPHDYDNVVPCCGYCNWIKSNKTLEEFIDHIKKIYNFYCKEIVR